MQRERNKLLPGSRQTTRSTASPSPVQPLPVDFPVWEFTDYQLHITGPWVRPGDGEGASQGRDKGKEASFRAAPFLGCRLTRLL